MLGLLLAAASVAQPHNALPIDPRHHRDARCPKAIQLDGDKQRDPASKSSYLWTPGLPSAAACAYACCGDWSCEAFAFIAPASSVYPKGKGNCTGSSACCVFKDDLDALVAGAKGVTTGRRSKLPARAAPYANSTKVLHTVLEPKMYVGINGDEFPITWGKDGNQYTGAGDNSQANETGTPLSFFRVKGGPTELGCTYPPNKHNQPTPTCKNINEQGKHVPVTSKSALAACPSWHDGIPNLKSSGVISVDGVLYWAISCFNYGDNLVFNRQRYGPAWIITSHDNGVSWNVDATNTSMFPGRLSAPRFVQYGQDFAGAPDDWVYVYFPGTSGDSAFFENNDQMLLGRVNKHKILERSAYQFFNGIQLDGSDVWTSDSTIATSVWHFPLQTSVQQANYHAGMKRYIFANWAWISYDGYGRPDHTADEVNGRTGHQRTQLSLVEAPNPWGPFKVFYRNDDWGGIDLQKQFSVGGYTPVIPPAWIGDNDFWIVFTQCCGNPRPPLNNYNFNAQRVTFKLSDGRSRREASA